jgi:Ca2+-binding EF-hand superfamily protein
LNSGEEIEEKKVRKALEILNINLSEQENNILLNPFLTLFEIKKESDSEGPKIYNFPSLVTTMLLMTKSKSTDKSKAIFRVFDHDCSGSLNKETSEKILRNIFEGVRKYSELFSELDSFKIAAQGTKVTDSVNFKFN